MKSKFDQAQDNVEKNIEKLMKKKIEDWKEKLDQHYSEVDDESFVSDLKRAGYEVTE